MSEFLTLGEVRKLLPFQAGYQWIEARELAGEFPKGTRLSARKIIYRRDEIEDYLSRFRKNNHVTVTHPETGSPSSKPRPGRPAKRKNNVRA
jgi:predicted DNA-binding transcriptional regulator AlpA